MAAAHKALTMASTVTGQHKGSVDKSSDAKLKVGGKPVLLGASIDGKTVTGCIVVDDTNTSTLHCKKVASVTVGAAAKLKVAGDPVMLDSLAGTTDGTPPQPPGTQPLAKAEAVQAKLRAN